MQVDSSPSEPPEGPFFPSHCATFTEPATSVAESPAGRGTLMPQDRGHSFRDPKHRTECGTEQCIWEKNMGVQLNDRKSLWKNEVLLTPGSPDSLTKDPGLCPSTGTVRNTQGLCAYVCVQGGRECVETPIPQTHPQRLGCAWADSSQLGVGDIPVSAPPFSLDQWLSTSLPRVMTRGANDTHRSITLQAHLADDEKHR